MILDSIIDILTAAAEKLTAPISRRLVRRLTERRERHGISLSMYIEAAPLQTNSLWPKLEGALDLIAVYSPLWINRIRQTGISIHVRRIPGTRALIRQPFIYLDPYLLADFLPAQIASSIVHEATHGVLRAKGFVFDPQAPAREERACRRSELRFGNVLKNAGVAGADSVIERVADLINAPDDEVGVVIDYNELNTIRAVTRIKDLDMPMWYKRSLARRAGVLGTPQGEAAFGARKKDRLTIV